MACMFCTRCGGCELGRLVAGGVKEGECVLCKTPLSSSDKVCPQCGAPNLGYKAEPAGKS